MSRGLWMLGLGLALLLGGCAEGDDTGQNQFAVMPPNADSGGAPTGGGGGSNAGGPSPGVAGIAGRRP